MKKMMKNMKKINFCLLSLLCVFWANSAFAQTIKVDINQPEIDLDYMEFPCINVANEFYNIRSNVILTKTDYKLISLLDNELYKLDLYPEDCFMFSFPHEKIITFKLNSGFDRTCVIRDNKIVYHSDVQIVNAPPKRKQPQDIKRKK